jgi:hypothetical protein
MSSSYPLGVPRFEEIFPERPLSHDWVREWKKNPKPFILHQKAVLQQCLAIDKGVTCHGTGYKIL